ncbi:dihydrofolate reductase family protein [Actinoalloteichus caeruleus]|uniref:dihydrofolate reductase family protein n=1 Tax=Actinoalloteichus cyanogriseus TaxID=2893586 RepID=UPI003AACCB6C
MRELTYVVASTLDGVIAPPDGSDPSAPGGLFDIDGDHLGTLVDEYPELVPVQARRALGIDPPNRTFDTVLEGRGSYDMGLRVGVTNAYPHLRHLVFSRSLTESPDPTVELVSGDPVTVVRELKREPGAGIWLCGGGRLAGALLPEIDRLVIKLNPVVAGAGIALFGGAFDPTGFRLVETKAHDSGVLFLTYTRS